VAQLALFDIFRYISRVTRVNEPEPYLRIIVKNRAKEIISKRVVTDWPAGRAETADPQDEHPTPQEDAESADSWQRLREAVEQLPPNYRAVIVRFYWDSMSCEDIATELRRPLGTVKTWLHRARAILAGGLGDERGD
jgi:RNA polymerase sigma-70 factor (ECF subfamily)